MESHRPPTHPWRPCSEIFDLKLRAIVGPGSSRIETYTLGQSLRSRKHEALGRQGKFGFTYRVWRKEENWTDSPQVELRPKITDVSEIIHDGEKSEFRDYEDESNPQHAMVKRTYYNMHTNQTVDYVRSKVNWFK